MKNQTLQNVLSLVGRLLLAFIFIKSGYGKIGGYEGTAGYMTSAGVPMVGLLLPLTILVELGGGILLALGYKARWAAAVIALFLVPVTFIFHNPGDAAQIISFQKNLAIIGGMLYVVAFGAGKLSLDVRTDA